MYNPTGFKHPGEGIGPKDRQRGGGIIGLAPFPSRKRKKPPVGRTTVKGKKKRGRTKRKKPPIGRRKTFFRPREKNV